MSKIYLRRAVVALSATFMSSVFIPMPAEAGEGHHLRHRGYARVLHYEDSCGCLNVTYSYHREMRYTFGPHFDPRSFDQTEPYYYYGPVRAYRRYWVSAYPHSW
jgi:hypothetical protein